MLAGFCCLSLAFLHAAQVKVATYNCLNFPDAVGMQRVDDLRTVLDFVEPDILAVQEMQSQYGMDLFLNSVLNHLEQNFSAVPFHDGPDTDNGLFYRTETVEFMDARYIPTGNRDIAQYRLRLRESGKELLVFSAHLKASQGPENEAIRLQEAAALRSHLDSIGQGRDILVMGDFNFYYAEPGFLALTNGTGAAAGQLFDPLDASGAWHDNDEYAYLHTQSSRYEQLGDGGASGGLDDRFDMILCSCSLLDTAGLYLPMDTYHVCGNDENHFNESVNNGINQSVSDDVADALYYASDHLPVFVSIVDGYSGGAAEDELIVFPNPMVDHVHVKFPWFEDFRRAEVAITDITGRRVYETQTMNPINLSIWNARMAVGVYFVHVFIETAYSRHRFMTKLAVLK
jgi:endonuclease/exonuclease/phosphatase family metal-dependent hydrolase